MMSPDPPREERQDESEDTTNVTDDPMTIQAAWVDMDDADELMFVPEGPHELDMGGSESEYSTDDEDLEGSPTFRDNIEETEQQEPEVEGQARGYYQLLIPFPVAERSASSDDPESLHTPVVQSSRRQPSNLDADVEVHELPTEEISELTEAEIAKREIDLTEDKVETIKSVMKGFVLPQASIPGWASEIDEDVWKKRLFDTFDTKINQ